MSTIIITAAIALAVGYFVGRVMAVGAHHHMQMNEFKAYCLAASQGAHTLELTAEEIAP